MGDEEVTRPKKNHSITFEFPIQDHDGLVQMKNIPLSSLPNFHGLVKEDIYTFLFEFDVIFCSYYYSMDTKKVKLFPATLNDMTLC